MVGWAPKGAWGPQQTQVLRAFLVGPPDGSWPSESLQRSADPRTRCMSSTQISGVLCFRLS